MKKFKRIHIIVMDSVGIGEAPDAAKFGDVGAHTLLHIAQSLPEGLDVPNMQKMGLGNIYKIKGINTVYMPTAYYTKMQERSSGKDTMTGHWEMMGLYIAKPFHTFPDGFPAELITKIEEFSGRKVIGNCTASGTEIIKQYGERQMKTGELIVYTSADSVLQIAAHEEVIPLDELYNICQYCRDITKNEPYSIGRIIARPYVGSDAGSFIRTPNRRDFSLKPFGKTVLDTLKEAGLSTIAVGKIHDIFDGEGITKSIHTVSNMDGVDKLLEVMDQDFTGLSFTNLVEFDSKYGHRRDPIGYGKALEEFDARLDEIQSKLRDDDLLIITADHGNDPTFKGTDHTREFVPLLVFSNGLKSYGALPVCDTFADLGATVADNFEVNAPDYGKSFLDKLI